MTAHNMPGGVPSDERQVADYVAHCFCSQDTWSGVHTCCRCRFRAIRTNPALVVEDGQLVWLRPEWQEAHR